MKKLLLTSSLVFLLIGCGAKSDRIAQYSLKISGEQTEERQKELTNASRRVAERALESMGKKAQKTDVTQKDDQDPTLTFTLPDAASVATLTDILTSGFKLRVMEEAPTEIADITVDQTSGKIGFRETGITESAITWVTAAAMPGTTKGEVKLDFTQAGRDLLTSVFQRNQGKMIGIFVRDRLVSQMKVETEKPRDMIVISNVPSLQIAQVFADDVNVGLHVQFVPLTRN